MAKANIYSKILKIKNLTPYELEQKLKLGNGAVGKAIKRNSTVKKVVLDEISRIYPDIDLRALEIELLQEQNAGVETPATAKADSRVSEPEATYKKQPGEGDSFFKMFEAFLHEQREDRRMFMGEITKAEVAILETKKDLFDFKVYTDTRLQTDRLDILIHASELAALRETLIENNQDYLSQTPGKRREAFRTALARHHRAYNIDSIASQSGSKKRSQQAS